MQGIDLSWVAVSALLGTAVAAWNQIRGFFSQAASLVIENGTAEGFAAKALRFYAWSRLKRTPFGPKYYGAIHSYIRPLEKVRLVAFEKTGLAAKVFWRGWRPFVIVGKSRGSNGENWDASMNGIGFLFLRGTFDVDTLMREAVDALNEHQSGESSKLTRYRINRVIGQWQKRMMNSSTGGGQVPSSPLIESGSGLDMIENRYLGYELGDLGSPISKSPFSAMAVAPELEDAIEEARYWKQSERWFKDRGLIWRRGWLLYGRPGTGKTSLIRAIAQELDLPVFVYDIATLSNEEMTKEWNQMLSESPAMAVIEDIDAVFNGRTNTLGEMGGGLTYDCLLNCMSGIQSADGIFVVVTTNDISKIDPALGLPEIGKSVSSRPGRLDRAIEIPLPNVECRRRIAERICSDCPDEIAGLVAKGDNDTAAQFSERCSQVAIARRWANFTMKKAA